MPRWRKRISVFGREILSQRRRCTIRSSPYPSWNEYSSSEQTVMLWAGWVVSVCFSIADTLCCVPGRQDRNSRLSATAGARRSGNHHLLQLPGHSPPQCEVHAESDRHGDFQVRVDWQGDAPQQVSQCLESCCALGRRDAVSHGLHRAVLPLGRRVRLKDGAPANRSLEGKSNHVNLSLNVQAILLFVLFYCTVTMKMKCLWWGT